MISDSETVCDSCSMVKATQKISHKSMIKVKKSLKLIHIDLMGFVTIILTDEHYYILFKNDYSGVIKMYNLKSKNQIYEKYIEYKTLVKNHLKLTIKHLQINNDIEYNND